LSVALDGVGAVSVVDGKWVSSSTAVELLGSTTTEELLSIPNNIVLVVSGHPAEAQLVVDRHGETDVLLLIRHLVVAGLRSLNASGFKKRNRSRVKSRRRKRSKKQQSKINKKKK